MTSSRQGLSVLFSKKLNQEHGVGLRRKWTLSTSWEPIRGKAEVVAKKEELIWLSNGDQDKKPLTWEPHVLLIRIEIPMDPHTQTPCSASYCWWRREGAGTGQWTKTLLCLFWVQLRGWVDWQLLTFQCKIAPGKDKKSGWDHRSPELTTQHFLVSSLYLPPLHMCSSRFLSFPSSSFRSIAWWAGPVVQACNSSY